MQRSASESFGFSTVSKASKNMQLSQQRKQELKQEQQSEDVVKAVTSEILRMLQHSLCLDTEQNTYLPSTQYEKFSLDKVKELQYLKHMETFLSGQLQQVKAQIQNVQQALLDENSNE